MMRCWSKNKKGAALIYAIMVLLLLATVVVALTALSTSTYTDAVLAASDDQSYYYAKSIGLAVKEQFKDGYNIARILAELNRQEDDRDTYPDPKVTGTFNISNDKGELINGTLQIRYALDADNNVDTHTLEVRSACVVNNSVAVVTSIFTCEDDSESQLDYLADALTDYDVILTDTNNLNFDFSQADAGATPISIYIYAGEDDKVDNPKFDLKVDMGGKLTTTGRTTINGKDSAGNDIYHKITGNLTGYGDLSLNNIGVEGSNGIHCDGNVLLSGASFVQKDIYARGTVTINEISTELNQSYVGSYTDSSGGGVTDVKNPSAFVAPYYGFNSDGYFHSARSIYAQGAVTIGARAWVTGNILSHGNVTVVGKGAVAGGAYNSYYHTGNTMIGNKDNDKDTGNIYSEGVVRIQMGAVVRGNIYANGDVYVQSGSTVVGNIQSVNGNVYIWGGAVGGQVNCPKGRLNLNNAGDDAYCNYLAESDRDPSGRIVFGGIGLFQKSNQLFKHTCDTLSTTDCEYMSIISGNIYVETATNKTKNTTPFLSVWARKGAVYLKSSQAVFDNNGNRSKFGGNTAGNPYTYIEELNQKTDFWSGTRGNEWVNMFGAHIVCANIGDKKTRLYDAYMWNGWIGHVNARCLYLADVQVDAGSKIYAAQFLDIWGTVNNNYSGVVNYTRGFYGGYTYARSGYNAYTVIPDGVEIDVACKMPSYSGNFTDTVACGFSVKPGVEINKCTICVGAEDGSTSNAYVILGNEYSSLPGQTYFYATLNAYVGNFKLASGVRLSNVKSGTASKSATIYAEVTGGGNPNYESTSVRPNEAKNSFYVERKIYSDDEYRVGSTIQVKGNIYIAGWVYTLEHFKRDDGSGTFTNTSDARLKGVFRSTGDVNLLGKDCFTDVEAINTASTTTISGDLKLTSLLANGKFKMTSANHTLDVSGDLYVGNLQTQILSTLKVGGKLTINNTNQTTVQPQRAFSVGGDLYVAKGNVKLGGGSYDHSVGGKLEAAAGNIEIASRATVGGAKTPSGKSLTIVGGTLRGDFDTETFLMSSGAINPASGRVFGKVSTYTHTGGSIKMSDILVTSSSATAVKIEGTSSSNKASADDIYITSESGGASVTGGSNVKYSDGSLRVYQSSTIIGGFEMGISVKNGDLTIGNSENSSDRYNVGTSITSGDADNDLYRIIYAKGKIDWRYCARGKYDSWPSLADATRINAGGDVILGKPDYYVPGLFSAIRSTNGKVQLFVEKVDEVYAKSTSWVHVSNALGMYKNSTTSGIRVVSGDAYVYGKTGAEYLRGNNVVSGFFSFMTAINTEGCLIKCKDIIGLNLVKNKTIDGYTVKDVSVYLTSPTPETDGYYNLNTCTGNVGIGGSFSIERNLKFNSPVVVLGELYVNGYFKYNNSLENVICLGGLHCKNEKVNITGAFRGNVHLPDATALTLSTDIGSTAKFGLNAPKVKNFDLNLNMEGSLNLASCDSLSVAAGKTVSGSIIIKNDGTIVNNGTIGGSVKCGQYSGSGTVGKDVITLKSKVTNTITGRVDGSIWSNGSLKITPSYRLGDSNTYIYAAGDITIENATFNPGMDYILSSGGDISIKECPGFIPKVWNKKGKITFSNSSESKRASIAGVASWGTSISFGTDKNTNYQTVTGKLQWKGSVSSGTGVQFYGESTKVEGVSVLFGTGNVVLAKTKFTSAVHLWNKGTVTHDAGGKIEGAVRINNTSSSEKKVTTATFNSTITGNVVIYGAKDTTTVTLSTVTGNVHMYTGKMLTLDGKVTGNVRATSVQEVQLNKECTGTMTATYGKLTTKLKTDSDVGGKIGGSLRAYDEELHINADVGGNVTHTAHNISSDYPMKLVALGTQKKMITVNGNITVHGRLVDNSQQLGSKRTIKVKGAYYADLQKEFNDGNSVNGKGCTSFNFTEEGGGRCYILGSKSGNYTVYNTVFNIFGHLSIYTFYNESTATWYQMTFKQDVTCKSLFVNCRRNGDEYTTSTTTTLTSAPEQRIGFYGKSDNSTKAKGIDKKCWFEDFETYNKLDIFYTNDTYSAALPTNPSDHYNDRMYFAGKVNVTGICAACNTKFGSDLVCGGQVSLYRCCTFATGYSDDTNHCTATSNDNGINVADHGAFLHTDTSLSGDNFFRDVKTYSNVAVYKGVTHIYGGSVFKGCVFSGSGQSNEYKGHRSTKLFYFGDSVELYGSSAIWSSGQADVDLCCGRTIVWVNKGALVVRDGSYIGAERNKASNTGGTTNTNRHSLHPGIFVSDSGGGTVKFDGTSYNKGGVYVVGKNSSTPSTITLDICAYKQISISNYGQVYGKNAKNDTFRYIAGLYTTSGSISESDNGFFGYNHLDSDTRGKSGCIKTKVFTGSGYTGASNYTPNGSSYCTNMNKKQGTYEKLTIGSRGDHTTSFSQTTAQLTQCYTPKSSAPTVTAPTEIKASDMTNSQIGTVDDSLHSDIEMKEPDNPAQPTFSATGGFDVSNSDASVNPVVVNNTSTPEGPCTATPEQRGVSAAKATAASSNIEFKGTYASSYPVYWPADPNYSVSVTPTHPSTKWTSDVTNHFDKTKKEYWNTRFMPYVWKLPYYDSEGKTTNAKRVLKTGDSREVNGHMMLKQTSSTDYYTNQEMYKDSSLAGKAGSLFDWRKAGMSGNNLADYVVLNGYPEWDNPFDKDPDHKRRTKVLVFESGELPYSAFFMGGGTGSEDFASWYGSSSNKSIRGTKQKAWKLGDPDVSFYDGSLIFYACKDPSNPYKANNEKDLHVVLPQGIGFDFVVDAENTVTVVGNGRVFLYLTSGDTIYFRAKATGDVHANPVGGLRLNEEGTYSPLLYIIGAGTNIDLNIDRMPLGAFVYMPFGSTSSLYDASKGSLKQYNNFKSLANNLTFSGHYTGTGETTSVARNRITFLWDNTSGGARSIWGTIVVDSFRYAASANCLNFKNYKNSKRVIIPDWAMENEEYKKKYSKTRIYKASYRDGSTTKSGASAEYSIATFLTNAPNYSTSLLNWTYKEIKVEG